MISFDIETPNSGEKFSIIDIVHKFDVAITTFKYLLNKAVLEERLNKTDIEKVG